MIIPNGPVAGNLLGSWTSSTFEDLPCEKEVSVAMRTIDLAVLSTARRYNVYRRSVAIVLVWIGMSWHAKCLQLHSKLYSRNSIRTCQITRSMGFRQGEGTVRKAKCIYWKHFERVFIRLDGIEIRHGARRTSSIGTRDVPDKYVRGTRRNVDLRDLTNTYC
jgi:hypothetical protein